jgi:1,4-alpha-glucan branching enzyme
MNAPVDPAALALAELLDGRLTDPFAVLGPHNTVGGRVIRTFQPGAVAVEAAARADGKLLSTLQPIGDFGLFVGAVADERPYNLRIVWPGGAVQETEDPYSFAPVLSGLDLHLFTEGAHWNLAERLGARLDTIQDVEGVVFSVWAPNARQAAVIGDFNSWDGRRHPMRLRHEAGVWELFVPRLKPGARYKFELIAADGRRLQKADPLARATEAPPATASVVAEPLDPRWTDDLWMAARDQRQRPEAPISIYEVHAASWLRPERDAPGGASGVLDWDGLAARLIPYAVDMGFTHVELLPIMEHPFGGSWGYQPLSQFAPSARFGAPQGFARFVDACHRHDLGVILDWVPAHFPTDAHGLAQFDGTALYEHADPREGFHQDWNTLIYNLGRREVAGFLIASALYWLETFHVDGLRVDAVASMLYRDYSRKAGEWVPNRYGGRENLEAIDFLKRLNTVIAERAPGAITLAEESTAFPGVSAPVGEGGLGFAYKWNMGWMHDTLDYIEQDPLYRSWRHSELTFGLVYAFSERFVLPLSHDEVVHGKGSLIGKMPGDPQTPSDMARKFENLRAYLAFMWTHPGKKLLFMGGEIAQLREWSHDREIDWDLLSEPDHAGVQHLVRDLNRLYAEEPGLHLGDASPEGFQWLVGDDVANSVFVYLRKSPRGDTPPLLIALNMTPVPRFNYRVGAPEGGGWREILNTDADVYGGGNLGAGGRVEAQRLGIHGQAWSLELTLPPLAAVVLKPERV